MVHVTKYKVVFSYCFLHCFYFISFAFVFLKKKKTLHSYIYGPCRLARYRCKKNYVQKNSLLAFHLYLNAFLFILCPW